MAKTVVEMIDPRDQGAGPLDLKKPVFDPNAVARANEAIKAMAGEFQAWLERDVTRVQDARLAAEASAWSNATLETLLIAAHDLKGLGGSYDYPIVTQIAASLCRLIETDPGKTAARAEPSLVAAHVDALRAAARGQIRTDAHPIGRALLQALEARVAALGVAPR
ncbi:Hpt domain-containing protein [Terricaulis sp.]|uniref:Hpt domain-containing protein n=1 Tax=Terricaulis sp. TaxID=2768686 RepID=UPI003784C807